MNFDHSRAQVLCQSFVNCSDWSKWTDYRGTFKKFKLSSENAKELKSCLFKDANDYYFKGILSLFEAVNGLTRNLFSWSTVKLYYSVHYFLRCNIAVKNYALIVNKSLYLLKAEANKMPKEYNGKIHKAIINVFRTLDISDKLQTQSIEGENAYIWLMKKREQVNYQERIFHDPECPSFWDSIAREVNNKKLDELLSKYVNDNEYIYCFQEDSACLALPIKRAILTKNDMLKENGEIIIPNEKLKLLKTLRKKITKLDFLFK